MKIDHIRTFLEIATCGNFKRAAGNLNVTQSTVSARVKAMEEQFGRPLFTRGHAGVELTYAGQRFRRYALGIERLPIDADEIVDRLIFSLINEGFKILEEGIAQRAGDIDVVYVFGYGFPAARGGPMHYADAIGLDKVYDTICAFRERHSAEYWEPAPLLEKLAKDGGSFAEWSKS